MRHADRTMGAMYCKDGILFAANEEIMPPRCTGILDGQAVHDGLRGIKRLGKEGVMQISGYSSLTEYYAELAKMRSQNAQSSGKSSAAEMFSKTDSDESGGISKSEFAAMFSQVQSTGATEGSTSTVDAASSTQSMEKRPPSPPEMSSEELEEMFAEADLDGDGALSIEEFTALSEKMRPNQPEGAQQGAQTQSNGTNGNGNSIQSLFAMLQGSQSSYGNLASSSSTSSFAELLNIFGGESSGSSTSSSYIQSLVKNAYGA